MGDTETTYTFAAARPIFSVDDKEIPALSEGLLTLLVEETTEGLYRCEAAFGNWGAKDNETGFLYFDRQLFDFGKPFAIDAGEKDTAARIFNGRIMGLEAQYPVSRPPELLILAEDKFQDLRMTRRSRSFEDMSDSDVIEQVAREHGLHPEVDIDGPTYRVLTQVNRSDLAFLRQRVRAADGEIWLEQGKLKAIKHSRRDAGEVTLSYPNSLKEFSVSADLANQCTSLVVGGWDVSGKEGIAYEAEDSVLKEELNGGESGGSILQSAIGERVERLVHFVPENQNEAQSLAESEFRVRARRFVSGRGWGQGDGRIRVGVHLNLKGLGDMFDGKYYIVEVRHTFDGINGFRTYFRVERPGL
jgi:hypothetical protein